MANEAFNWYAVTADYLRSRLSYSPETGVFVWLPKEGLTGEERHWNRRWAGTIAGSPDADGYNLISLAGRRYRAARLAWLYVHGEWPESGVDHEDRVPSHDWIKNLRPADQSQNNANMSIPKSNKSGVKGVSWCSQTGRWRSSIQVRKKAFNLGRFAEKDEAIRVRREAEKKYFGEFAGA